MKENWVVSYGGGTNSTAVLVGMHERGLRPDLIMFADTRNEKQETYNHQELMQEWCASVGFPPITVVRNELPQGVIDGSLYDECFRLGALPSKTFGRSSCSMKWKVQPQQRYTHKWMRQRGLDFIVNVVGYDLDELHRAADKQQLFDWKINRYLLIEWGWGRDECVAAIARAGLKQPGKSACFMCPSSKKPEVLRLKEEHPLLYFKAIAMERRALAGEGQSPAARVKGLGRHWNWETFAGSDVATPEVDCGCYDGGAE